MVNDRHGSPISVEEIVDADTPPPPAPAPATRAPRFSRIVPARQTRPQLDEPTLRRVAAAMTSGGEPIESAVPSGYTYVGQFIAHDLSFDDDPLRGAPDTVSVSDVGTARSPSLDLDCLYGRGPSLDPQYYAYDGVHLLTGMTQPGQVVGPGAENHPGFDLPRAGDGSAVIPDPRNDESLLVAQTHAAFIRFHNRVADLLAAQGVPLDERFDRARALVVTHYQWMVRTDFLPRVVDPAVVNAAFAATSPVFDVRPTTMPVEFSVAGFRLGHSMVRDEYTLNSPAPLLLEMVFALSGRGGGLAGKPALESTWILDLRRFYDFAEAGRPELAEVPRNLAHRIDTRLADPLARLPPEPLPEGQELAMRHNLAFRNLTRARMVGLASGQDLVDVARQRMPDLVPLTREEILKGDRGARLDALSQPEADALAKRTPLWFYALREAELGGGRLRGVGGRLVAETFRRAMEESRISILRDPPFRPSLVSPASPAPGTPPPPPDTFRMVELLLFTARGEAAGLNPLGD